MDSETKKFRGDLLDSVKQMHEGDGARLTQVKQPAAAVARAKMGLSEQQFADLIGVSKSTLQDWEQGRSEPKGAEGILIKIALARPELLREIGI